MNIIKMYFLDMSVALVVIVENGQAILNIIKIMTLNEEIYKTVMKIPYGKVATYGQIATKSEYMKHHIFADSQQTPARWRTNWPS